MAVEVNVPSQETITEFVAEVLFSLQSQYWGARRRVSVVPAGMPVEAKICPELFK
jgi:hypothetical protein